MACSHCGQNHNPTAHARYGCDALAESHAELLAALDRLLSCCEWKGTATATLNITEFQAALGTATGAVAKARAL